MEVLVASCVIGIFLGVVLAGFSINMKNAKNADNYIKAVQLAQLKFNGLATMKLLKESRQKGDFGNTADQFRWQTSVKKKGDGRTWLIQIKIFWGRGSAERSFSMNSMIISEEGKLKGKAKKKKVQKPELDIE